jgi:hypothetical protein
MRPMLNLPPRFLLSPRFFALPLIALGVIVALAQAGRHHGAADATAASPVVYRAVNCTAPANAARAACTVATGTTSRVR